MTTALQPGFYTSNLSEKAPVTTIAGVGAGTYPHRTAGARLTTGDLIVQR